MAVWALFCALQAPGEYAVHVREAPLKDRPSLMAPTVELVPEGRRLKVVEVSGAWARVQRGEGFAWIHVAAIIERGRYRPLAGTPAAAQLAGDYIAVKGFNPQAEQARRTARGMEAYYRVVDRIERTPEWTHSADRAAEIVAEFRRSRGLKP